jgi:hypothetical protein
LRSFTCGTSTNITTVARPCPLRRARSVTRRKSLSWTEPRFDKPRPVLLGDRTQ